MSRPESACSAARGVLLREYTHAGRATRPLGSASEVEHRRGSTSSRVDWSSWVMLVWMLGILVLYTRMVLEARFPGALAMIRRWLDPILG